MKDDKIIDVEINDLLNCDGYVPSRIRKNKFFISYYNEFIREHGFNEDMVKPFMSKLLVGKDEVDSYCEQFENLLLFIYLEKIEEMTKAKSRIPTPNDILEDDNLREIVKGLPSRSAIFHYNLKSFILTKVKDKLNDKMKDDKIRIKDINSKTSGITFNDRNEFNRWVESLMESNYGPDKFEIYSTSEDIIYVLNEIANNKCEFNTRLFDSENIDFIISVLQNHRTKRNIFLFTADGEEYHEGFADYAYYNNHCTAQYIAILEHEEFKFCGRDYKVQ